MNIIIPMAGRGQRFKKGYDDPKPFVDVKGKTMVELAVDNLNLPKAFHVFVVRASHMKKYSHVMDKILDKVSGAVVAIEGDTEGPASTCLKAKSYFNYDEPLLYANCDQYLEWNPQEFLNHVEDYDGGLLVHRDTKPYSSFAVLDESGYVKRTVEKEVISDISSTGIYYWSKGSDFVRNAKSMIKKDRRASNGEFYAINIYNEGIEEGKKYTVYFLKRFWRLGVPGELEEFNDNK